MNKKLMAVAVATALGTPAVALAQASTVQIYGTLYLEYATVDQGTKATGVTPPPGASAGEYVRIDQLQSPGSNIGFKGEEALGGGLSAWFQCESTAGISGPDAGTWCGRNSALGLKGGFGNVFFGNWDTPFKRMNSVTRGTVNETGFLGTGFLMFGNSASYLGRNGGGAFLRRQNNVINYDSPNWGGFQLLAQVSTSRSAVGVGGSTSTTAAVSGAKPRLFSVGAIYSNGPLVVNGAWEQHRNYQAGSPNVAGAPSGTTGVISITPVNPYAGKDNGWHVGAAYTFPVGGGLKLAGIYSRLEYDTSATTEIDRHSWQVAVDWKIVGPHGIRTGYTKAGDTKGSGPTAAVPAGTLLQGTAIAATAGDNGADMWQLSYYYTMSKRTEAGVGYARLNNDSQGRFGMGDANNPNYGQKQDAFGTWLRHTF